MKTVEEISEATGVRRSCGALGVPRATYYRRRKPKSVTRARSSKRVSFRRIPDQERLEVLELLNSTACIDQAPAQVFGRLLEEDKYYCSERTMYRILAENRQVRERRNVLRHPQYKKPELLATEPNQVWSWDITKLKGPIKWTYFYLYVIIDIYSRYVVGWLLAHVEQARLAERLIRETCLKQQIAEEQLVIHSDRGPSMTSLTVAQLLDTLRVERSLSRPYHSEDNPYSESHFKTMKYRPPFPKRFESFNSARNFCQEFFPWYNREHRHAGIAMLTPAVVHHGRACGVLENRQQTMDSAYARHPERFVNGPPKVAKPPAEVWINPPVVSPRGAGEEVLVTH